MMKLTGEGKSGLNFRHFGITSQSGSDIRNHIYENNDKIPDLRSAPSGMTFIFSIVI